MERRFDYQMIRTGLLAFVLCAISAVEAQPAFTIYSRVVSKDALPPDPDKAVAILCTAFVEEYAKQNNLLPTPAELAAMKRVFDSGKTGQPSSPGLDESQIAADFRRRGLSDQEAQAEASKVIRRAAESSRRISEAWTRGMVLNFKLNRYLWNRHGGKVTLSAFGLHTATDATIKEAERLEREGTLTFNDPQLREPFFRYFRQYRGDGVVEGERARSAFARPIWESHSSK